MNTTRTSTLLGMLALSALLLSSARQQPLLAQERPPIIDMHLHADLPPHHSSCTSARTAGFSGRPALS